MANDYGTIGLDSQLNSVNQLGANDKYVPAYDFVTNNESGAITRAFLGTGVIGTAQFGTASITTANIANGAITNAKIASAAIGTANIGTLNWQQSSGGTATFGGTLNGNGLVQVLNNSGGTVVSLDKTGITVNNGSITIQNSS